MANEYSPYGTYGFLDPQGYAAYQQYQMRQKASAQSGSLIDAPSQETPVQQGDQRSASAYNPSAYSDILSSGSIFSKYKDDVFASQFFASNPWEKYTGAQSQNDSPFPPEVYGKNPAQGQNPGQNQAQGVSFTI